MRTHTVMESPIGALTLAATDGVLSAVYMRDHRHAPDERSFGDRADGDFAEAIEQLTEYFAGERTDFTLRTRAAGTDFQQRVWRALTTIPYGTTSTYAELAVAIGAPHAVRAVGAANGRNPLSIVVPCHRVIGADGSLTGYGGGIERKRFLLDLEKSVASGALW